MTGESAFSIGYHRLSFSFLVHRMDKTIQNFALLAMYPETFLRPFLLQLQIPQFVIYRYVVLQECVKLFRISSFSAAVAILSCGRRVPLSRRGMRCRGRIVGDAAGRLGGDVNVRE